MVEHDEYADVADQKERRRIQYRNSQRTYRKSPLNNISNDSQAIQQVLLSRSLSSPHQLFNLAEFSRARGLV
jgi:hypothetical protein